MKMNSKDYNTLKQAINTVASNHGGIDELIYLYEHGKFPRSDVAQDLNKRFKWDLYHASSVRSSDFTDEYSDEHIYTALKSIIPHKLTVKY